MKEIKRGEIYSADFGVGFGSEQGGGGEDEGEEGTYG